MANYQHHCSEEDEYEQPTSSLDTSAASENGGSVYIGDFREEEDYGDYEDNSNIGEEDVQSKKKGKRGAKKRVYNNGNSTLIKYWTQRYRLFSKFDEGIQLDDGMQNGGLNSSCSYEGSCNDVLLTWL